MELRSPIFLYLGGISTVAKARARAEGSIYIHVV